MKRILAIIAILLLGGGIIYGMQPDQQNSHWGEATVTTGTGVGEVIPAPPEPAQPENQPPAEPETPAPEQPQPDESDETAEQTPPESPPSVGDRSSGNPKAYDAPMTIKF